VLFHRLTRRADTNLRTALIQAKCRSAVPPTSLPRCRSTFHQDSSFRHHPREPGSCLLRAASVGTCAAVCGDTFAHRSDTHLGFHEPAPAISITSALSEARHPFQPGQTPWRINRNNPHDPASEIVLTAGYRRNRVDNGKSDLAEQRRQECGPISWRELRRDYSA
jgi:hypothetical protein